MAQMMYEDFPICAHLRNLRFHRPAAVNLLDDRFSAGAGTGIVLVLSVAVLGIAIEFAS